MRHLIDPMDLTVEEIDQLLAVGDDIIQNPAKYSEICKGKKLATLFYEPSTRTRLSFESAMLELGGSVIGFSSADSSSAAKGESVADTIRVIGCFADIAAMRHPKEGAPMVAAMNSPIPVINAGDGGHQHPTQTLTDLMTIHRLKGHLDHLTIGLCGDLINGRTVHSLLKAMSCFEGNHFILISTPELGLPSYVKDILNASNCDFEEVSSLEEVLPKLDVLYMTRIQQERFASREEYLAQKDTYILTTKKMQVAKKDLVVLHPLPRVDEIEVALDDDPRAMYFKQAKYGMYVRMALIITMLNLDTHTTLLRGKTFPGAVCKNPNCITHTETYLPKSFISLGNSLLECEFCNERLLMEH